jgi:predicted transcriptional regulator
LTEAEETLVCVQIISCIIDIVNKRNLTEAEAAGILGISKLEISQYIILQVEPEMKRSQVEPGNEKSHVLCVFVSLWFFNLA